MPPSCLPLACPVRGCALPLDRQLRAWTCANGHSHDIARSGYVNLLQPQDRRSAAAGDSREAVEARARLLDAGIGATIVRTIVDRAAAVLSTSPGVVAELGCGSGELLAQLAAAAAAPVVGIDLSTAAIERAARRFRGPVWVVANADRRLPLLDHSVALVLSVNARRNPAECTRVLEPGGRLVVAVPGPRDLIELRSAVQGEAVERDRLESAIQEHTPAFTLLDRFEVGEQHHLNRDALLALLQGTYRGRRLSAASPVEQLDAMAVTVATAVAVFERR